MRPTLSVVLLLAPALSAQTTISLTSATPIAAMTSASGGPSTFNGIPANQPIGSGSSQVFLNTSQTPSGGYLSATTIAYPTQPFQQGIGFNFFERAYARGASGDEAGSSASATASGATFGPHAVLATFSAAPNTTGNIRISFRNNGANGGVTGAMVDVDDDNVVEFNQATPDEVSIPYTIGASGQVVVRVSNECRAAGNGTNTMAYTWTELWVGFMPDLTATCTITPYGQGCGGVQAGGTEVVAGNTRTVAMLATGCFANSPVLVATGSQQIALPLLAGCTLLTNAEGVTIVGADASGNATVSWQIPVTVVGTTYVQMLPLSLQASSLVLTAGNGVEVRCFR